MSFGSDAPKNTTTTTKVELPSYLQGPMQEYAQAASLAAGRPYQAYGGPRIAGIAPAQQAGFDQIIQRAQGGSPETNAARNLAIGTMQGQGFRNPGTNQYTGATNPYTGIQNNYAGATNQFTNVANPMAMARNQFADVANPLMGSNPFLNNMVGNAQRDVVQNFERAVQPQTNSLANFNNAFGGSAHTELMSRDRENLMRSLGDVSTNLRGADYANSQNLMAQDLSRRGGLEDSNLSRISGNIQSDLSRMSGLAATDLARNAGIAGQDIDRGAQLTQADLARNSGLAANDMQLGQQAYDSERARQMQAMAFAPQLAQSGYQDIQALLGVGDFQRQQAQTAMDQAYEEFQARNNYPYQQALNYGNLLSLAQGGNTTTQTAPNANRPNTAAGVLGGAATGLGISSMMAPAGAAGLAALGPYALPFAIGGGLLGAFG